MTVWYTCITEFLITEAIGGFGDLTLNVRETPQRRAVRRALEEATHPLSPQELCAAAKAYAPRIGIATVYRTIRRLVDDGWAAAVALPGEAPRYEPAHASGQHYFQCRICGKVYRLDGHMDTWRPQLPQGFTLERSLVALRGVCWQCPSGGH